MMAAGSLVQTNGVGCAFHDSMYRPISIYVTEH